MAEGHHVLYDCGMGSQVSERYPLFVVPSGGWKRPGSTLRKAVTDVEIRKKRSLVENGYSRIKGKWGIFDKWRRSRHMIGPTFYVAAALTNIDIQFTSPLRSRCCEKGDCPVCAYKVSMR